MPTQPGKTLFSPHYLETRLPAPPEWAEDCSEAFARLKARLRRQGAILPTLNESQTEQEFVKPALEILGWSYIVQVKAGGAGSLTRPDYALPQRGPMRQPRPRRIPTRGMTRPSTAAPWPATVGCVCGRCESPASAQWCIMLEGEYAVFVSQADDMCEIQTLARSEHKAGALA